MTRTPIVPNPNGPGVVPLMQPDEPGAPVLYLTSHPEPPLRDLLGQLWRVEEDCWIDTGIVGLSLHSVARPPPGEEADPDVWDAELRPDGRLCFFPGFVHDGSSVPFLGRWLDRRVSGWPGQVHDFSYRVIRAGERVSRKRWDALYRDMLRAFGSWWITSRLCYLGLRLVGGGSASRRTEYARRGAG
jgi:hypothetical protein